MKIGFARVSTYKQDFDEQLNELNKYGCEKIFHIKASGSSKENDEKLKELCDFIREDDVVVITKLNRLGRSTRKILSVIDHIHSKKAHLIALDNSIDTSNKNPFARAMVSLISVFAQLDRELILERTSEGRKAAIKAGKHMGRPPKLSEKDKLNIIDLLNKGVTISEVARKFNVTRTSIYRIKNKNS